MRRRLYFMVPDTRSTRQIRNELLLARIEDSHIHVMARNDMSLRVDEIKKLITAHHPEAMSSGIEPTIPAFP